MRYKEFFAKFALPHVCTFRAGKHKDFYTLGIVTKGEVFVVSAAVPKGTLPDHQSMREALDLQVSSYPGNSHAKH